MKVIVAIDQTVFSQQVIRSVVSRPWPIDTEFRILTVLEPLDSRLADTVELRLDPTNTQKSRDASQLLKKAREAVQKKVPGCFVHTELRQGDPKSEIIFAAADWMPDKIILGAHGHSPNRLLPGLIPRTVAQTVLCSVELVRLKATKAEKIFGIEVIKPEQLECKA